MKILIQAIVLAWYEIWMLKDIFKPLIVNNICPNLPLYMDTFFM